MQDIVFSFNLVTLALLFFLIFPLHWLVLKKQIFYWFDPLLFFVFFNSIAIALVIYLFFFMNNIKLEYFISFILCNIAFITGIFWTGRKGLPVWNFEVSGKRTNNMYNYSLLVDIFLIVSLAIMVFSNLLLLAVKGSLPIFSANPSEAKIVLYTGGWGLVKRINFALVNYVLAIPLIKIFHPTIYINLKRKTFYLSCIMVCILVLISMGSKSSLLPIINILFAVVILNRTIGKSIVTRSRSIANEVLILKWTKYVFVAATIMMLIIIVLSGVETSSADTILTRFVSAGDVYYFFYVFDIASDFHKTALDFVPHILNPLLGMFRVTSYEFSIGIQIIYYSIGLPMDELAGFGPQTQHPIEGLIYFGKYGAPFYSFFVGSAISWIRIGLLKKIGPYPNYLAMLIYVVLGSVVIALGTDVPLFMQIFFDLFIYGVIILIISGVLLSILRMKIG